MESPASDEECVFPVDNLNVSPSVPINYYASVLISFRQWFYASIRDFGDWKSSKIGIFFIGSKPSSFWWRRVPFLPLSLIILPQLDYLWPCAFAPANGVVPDPQLLGIPVPPVSLNFVPAFAGPMPRDDWGEDWEWITTNVLILPVNGLIFSHAPHQYSVLHQLSVDRYLFPCCLWTRRCTYSQALRVE